MSAYTSSTSAKRLGTGRPNAPWWLGWRDVENPIAPSSIASRRRSRIVATSSSVAGRSSPPSTKSRSVEWPTNAPTLRRLRRRSSASRYSGNVSKHQSMPSLRASIDMPSTFSNVRTMVSRCSGRVGATREAAVAHHHARDAVPARRREVAVPEDLRVVVGVDVDEPGRQHQPVEVDHLGAGVRRELARCTDGGDAVAGDGHVGGVGPARRSRRSARRRAAAGPSVATGLRPSRCRR